MNILLTMLIGAASYSTTYDDAMVAYQNENFPESIERFEELVYNRVYEPEVFYNLGNAYYRTGYFAPAIANYERAVHLKPSLAEAHSNLRRTVLKTGRALPRPVQGGIEPLVFFWHVGLKRSTSKYLAVVFWFLGWGLLVSQVFGRPKYVRRVTVLVFLISAVFMGSWYFKAHPPELAVANGNKIPVRYGTKPSDTVRFELFEGDRVHIDGRSEGWVRVVTADGQRGWSRAEYFIVVWPPYRGGGNSLMVEALAEIDG